MCSCLAKSLPRLGVEFGAEAGAANRVFAYRRSGLYASSGIPPMVRRAWSGMFFKLTHYHVNVFLFHLPFPVSSRTGPSRQVLALFATAPFRFPNKRS